MNSMSRYIWTAARWCGVVWCGAVLTHSFRLLSTLESDDKDGISSTVEHFSSRHHSRPIIVHLYFVPLVQAVRNLSGPIGSRHCRKVFKSRAELQSTTAAAPAGANRLIKLSFNHGATAFVRRRRAVVVSQLVHLFLLSTVKSSSEVAATSGGSREDFARPQRFPRHRRSSSADETTRRRMRKQWTSRQHNAGASALMLGQPTLAE